MRVQTFTTAVVSHAHTNTTKLTSGSLYVLVYQSKAAVAQDGYQARGRTERRGVGGGKGQHLWPRERASHGQHRNAPATHTHTHAPTCESTNRVTGMWDAKNASATTRPTSAAVGIWLKGGRVWTHERERPASLAGDRRQAVDTQASHLIKNQAKLGGRREPKKPTASDHTRSLFATAHRVSLPPLPHRRSVLASRHLVCVPHFCAHVRHTRCAH